MSYQIANAFGQVVYDEAEEAAREQKARDCREGEQFTATADCPQCGHMAVHWLDEPRLRPDVETPAQKGIRMINETIWSASLYAGGTTPRRWYDPPGTVVARVCVKCGYRWGQK